MRYAPPRILRLSPALLAFSLVWGAVGAQTHNGTSIATADEPEESAFPEVLTTSRLRQSKARTPGTVTILEGDLLRDLGVLNLWDAFRLVPGMTVGYVGSNDPVVSYHGTVAVEQRRLQVLVDGRSYYNASLADMDWTNLPVPMDAIDRIEVTRGPNAAAYGANSFLAVINIITQSPSDTHGVELRGTKGVRGDDGLGHYYASVGSRSGPLNWRISANQRRSDGFDFRYVPDPDGGRTDQTRNNRDGYDTLSLNYSGELTLGPEDQLDMEFGYHDVYEQGDPAEYSGFNPRNNPDVTGEDWHGSVTWHHEPSPDRFFHIQLYHQTRERRRDWRAFIDDPLANAFGQPPFEADLNEDLEEARTHLEFQHTNVFTPATQLVFGASYREDRYESDTFFNGKGNTNRTRVFANLEHGLTPWLTTNVGSMWEDDSLGGNFFSPRGAVNLQLSDRQTLRFVFSRAYRLPDPFESRPDWKYRGANITPEEASSLEGKRVDLGLTTDSPAYKELEEEKITSREISYFFKSRLGTTGMLQSEIKLFRDSLENLISGVTNIREWNLENNVDMTQKGAEVEASLDFHGTLLRASYGYIDVDGEYTGSASPDKFVSLESRMNARHSGSFAWTQRFGNGTKGSLTYYFTDQLRNFHFERLDTRLAQRWHLDNTMVELAAIYRHYLTNDPIYRKDNNWADQNHLFAEARLRF
ncbi:TonB-dependent receptor [Salicola sp. Rm-C-2C1-2]|uniref:TonB-dependent receptor plug domain-containing protein n=1 Tax=Salicola sp. Rm-C-2C1-2 TaxID=3141321 RepID=UPI0032E3E13C